MLRFVLKRLAAAVPLMLGVATLVFFLMEAAPGDPVDLLLGEHPVSPEIRQRVEDALGRDVPVYQRYLNWMGGLLRGDLGWSHSRNKPVRELFAGALPTTLWLTSAALALHLVLGLGLGIVAALRAGRWQDRWLTHGSLLVYGMPTFWLGLMALLAFGHWIPLFPLSSLKSIGSESWPWWRQIADRLWHLALPASVLGLASAASMLRFVRAGLLESFVKDFMRSARARGLGRGRDLLVHALRNALLPVINLVGLSLPWLFSGSLVIEHVFGWPGMGRLTFDAILREDPSIVLASTLLVSFMVVVGNLAADLGMAFADPRVTLDERSGR
ncbi:MAG: ABC transporter permease [Planctomycetota bacterium]|nr:ABC transporter permease [Planctomycetota bacterium]